MKKKNETHTTKKMPKNKKIHKFIYVEECIIIIKWI